MLYIPNKIRVGVQKREGTYTGKLAYVIYYNDKGKLAKEVSWKGWMREDLGDFENNPTEGFVLNKKVGGYDTGWNHRNTYCRVYDPRGFEFEITMENLLFILENTSSIKGKGLEGEFVYAWDGKDLSLLPISAPDYKQLSSISEQRNTGAYLSAKDLRPGYSYKFKNGENSLFLGKYKSCEDSKKGKNIFIFVSKYSTICEVSNLKEVQSCYFTEKSSVSGVILSEEGEGNIVNYGIYLDYLQYYYKIHNTVKTEQLSDEEATYLLTMGIFTRVSNRYLEIGSEVSHLFPSNDTLIIDSKNISIVKDVFTKITLENGKQLYKKNKVRDSYFLIK